MIPLPLFLVQSPKDSLKSKISLRGAMCLETQDAVAAQLRGTPAIWIACGQVSLAWIQEELPARPARNARLLVLGSANTKMPSAQALHAHFRFVVSAQERVQLLPMDELMEALGPNNCQGLFIGGVVDERHGNITLYREDLTPLVVPLSSFRPSGTGLKPDFSKLSLIDYGHGVRFGKYEAASDAILYEYDEAYRREAKSRLIDKDPTLGGSIRRLRLQKGLRQEDFGKVTLKTIARIERGEIKTPRHSTLVAIAKTTGVPIEQLGTF